MARSFACPRLPGSWSIPAYPKTAVTAVTGPLISSPTLARAQAQFHKPLIVSSAVRTVEYQKHLMRVNHNAADAEGDIVSPHLTGATIDIAKSGLSRREMQWMRDHLFAYQTAGVIDVEEEFRQRCFHITVYKNYSPASLRRPSSRTCAADRPSGSINSHRLRRHAQQQQVEPEALVAASQFHFLSAPERVTIAGERGSRAFASQVRQSARTDMSDPVVQSPAEVTPGLSQGQRIIDTFTAPSKTFNDIKHGNKSWWLPFVIYVVLGFAFYGVVNPKLACARSAKTRSN